MAYWLLKSEPDTWSYEDQKKKGAKGDAWTGVRNFTARRHLKEMKKGDRAFFYHTGDEKAVVGIVEVLREAYPDPTAKGRAVGGGGRQNRRAAAEAGDTRRHQGRAEAQGHGAGEVLRGSRCSPSPMPNGSSSARWAA